MSELRRELDVTTWGRLYQRGGRVSKVPFCGPVAEQPDHRKTSPPRQVIADRAVRQPGRLVADGERVRPGRPRRLVGRGGADRGELLVEYRGEPLAEPDPGPVRDHR